MREGIAFKLYFYENNKLFKKVAVEKSNYNNWIVGKGPESHIRLNNPRISKNHIQIIHNKNCLLYTSPITRDALESRFAARA